MLTADITALISWWILIMSIGLVFFPVSSRLFQNFFDKGYAFSKILGMIVLAYIVFILGTLKVLAFNQLNSFVILFLLLFLYWLFFTSRRLPRDVLPRFSESLKTKKIYLFEELLFFLALLFWTYVRSRQPDIHGLEKFMDYGFINSILRSTYFPPADMWFTPLPINYYYFGHLVTAVLTIMSGLPSSITYNLMISTIFSLTVTASFSIGANLMYMHVKTLSRFQIFAAGFLSALLVSIGGNLHALYAFFKPYVNEHPVPFWDLSFSLVSFPNSYWYPNATRFIYNTIHEFPLYSFVVSDLHGHVLSIPIVILILACQLHLFTKKIKQISLSSILLFAFLCAAAYMTNAWDGLIYFLLTTTVFGFILQRKKILEPKHSPFPLYHFFLTIVFLLAGFIVFSLPFNHHFKPFVSSLGILCAPEFLTEISRIGPFLFEENHCQKSPVWQLLILHGFFYFWVVSFIVLLYKKKEKNAFYKNRAYGFVAVLIVISSMLIIIPEFIYAKDIYPAHYRANTMFKLGYQAFIMLSLTSAFTVVLIARRVISRLLLRKNLAFLTPYAIISLLLAGLVFIYPYFAITSYYGNLSTGYPLDGTLYLQKLYPSDYNAILWLNRTVKGQPVIVEAQGDSYTDFARVSAHTGLPTILGWTVHEWLWRGTYDIPSPRITDISNLYESENITVVKNLIKKYHVSLVFIGDLERQKYPRLNESNFQKLGKVIYQKSSTKIYRLF